MAKKRFVSVAVWSNVDRMSCSPFWATLLASHMSSWDSSIVTSGIASSGPDVKGWGKTGSLSGKGYWANN